MIPNISREELAAHLDDDAFRLVDVLPRESFRAGHLPGALSLPLAEIEERAGIVLPDRWKPIVVYCASAT